MLLWVVALCLVGALERVQHRLRRDEPSRWWASNGRDVVNLVAAVLLGGALWVNGFSGPLCLAIAGSFVIFLTAAQATFERHRSAATLSLLAALVLGTPVVIAPARVATAYRAAIQVIFP